MAEEDGFVRMIADAQAFFGKLRKNNRKDWFDPRKEAYRETILKPAELFSTLMEEELSKLTGAGQVGKIFRIYRDVRFSKDKTPYNAHLHILWSEAGGAPHMPAFFFAADPDGVRAAVGAVGYKGEALTRYRKLIDGRGDDLVAAMEAAEAWLIDFGAEPLKRVPSGFDPDHAHAELLKRKGFVAMTDVTDWRSGGVIETVRDTYKTLMPVYRMLAEVVP
ncbi:DUF2461 domain-containing protein [Aestuariibius sp. 2305UL40-4]|uniref:DUF2461 domain-containing protein n=1 Tax=Aestuariibius violaceus TaxID=3234132 RepID=UPI00345EDE4E